MPTTTQTPSSGSTKRDPKLANAWKTKSVEELTDAEVLAMSDDEYMNEKQMAFFRLKLLTLKHDRSEEHTSELQSQSNLVCRLLLEKKKNKKNKQIRLTTQ